MADVVEKIIKRELKVKLTEAEVNSRRDEAANCQKTVDDTESELDLATKNYKEEKAAFDKVIEDNSERRSILLREVRERKATQLVECKEVTNYDRGMVEYHFGGEILEERPMEGDEHQRSLFEQEAESIPADGSDINE